MLKEFRKFLLRGNLLDLAVAVILGLAFNAVVNSFANDVLMNLIAAVFGQPTFDSITIGLGDGRILIGRFFTTVVNFVIIGFALFVVVQAFERLQQRRLFGQTAPEDEPTPSDEVALLTQIRDLLAARRQGAT
jgi:large conductance mechanosensitive channel